MIKIVLVILVVALIFCYGIFITPKLDKKRKPEIITFEDYILSRAMELHGNQLYGTNPYSYHLRKVLANVKKYEAYYGDDPDLMRVLEMAGVFHDTLEDVTGYTYNNLRRDAEKVFDDGFYVNMVCEIVFACTNDKGRTRAERAGDAYYAGIRKTGYAPFIKACDRLANIEFAKSQKSSLYKKYKEEMPEFINKITEPGNLIPEELKMELCSYLVD